MEDPVRHSARRPYFAYLFLAAVTLWLLAGNQGKTSPEESRWLLLAMILAGLQIGFWLARSVHGLWSACAFSFLFLMAMPRGSIAAIWPLQHLTIAAGIGLLLMLCVEYGRDRVRRAAVGMVGLGIWLVDSIIWIEAAASMDAPAACDLQCSRQMVVAFLSLGGLALTACAANLRKKQLSVIKTSRWMILPVFMLIFAPAAGFVLAQLWIPVPIHSLSTLDCWSELPARRPIGSSSFLASEWAGYPIWLIALIVVLGVWRTVGRGFRQMKKGSMPASWLIALWLAMTMLPGHALPVNQSLFVVLLGTSLAVFVVSDFLLLFFEQIALPTPPPGPSDVPHVPHP